MTVSQILLIVALVCFVVAALGFNVNRVNLVAAGLLALALRELL